jgi:glycosyltransferase involved in cell wall biosynthesis
VIQIAYAFRKPVVASSVGGIPEVVVDGVTGYLVPPGNAGAIADAVRRYFADDERDRFADAISRESETYSWERMVETVETVCERIASG